MISPQCWRQPLNKLGLQHLGAVCREWSGSRAGAPLVASVKA
jgi:hypothetical protein